MIIHSRSSLFIFVVIFALAASPLFSQEAIEPSSTENPEPTPIEQKSKEKAREEKPAKRERGNIEDMMTSDEFNSSGLSKLSMEELKNLNAWLQGYRKTTETKAAEKATAEATKKAATESRGKMDMILSRVDGTFNGVTGHTIIKLEDGSTWKQANADDRFHASVTDRPPVRVVHGTFGYKMRVVGTGEFYVDPVR